MSAPWKALSLVVAGFFGGTLGACATSDHATPATVRALSPSSRVYDGVRLRRMGAHTAWDAIRLLAPHYRLQDRRASGFVEIVPSRSVPRVVVDDHLLSDADLLRSIPATEIIAIQIVSGIDATTRFGTTGGPVIVVQTLASIRRR